MALGKRKREQQQMWVATNALPKSPGHVFYRKLNQLLDEAGFDKHAEELCHPYYAERKGRPSIPPGVYFRMLLVGFFEGIGSQRGIAWRCSDSLSLREFLGLAPTDEPPDHSSLTRVRDRLPLEVHHAVFLFVLQLAEMKNLLRGKTVGVDATMLEANAAMKSIVRRDSGDDWKAYLKQLIREEEGVEDPTDEDLRKFDQKRKNKKVSNDEWVSPSDPDSRISRMKDGRTHLAYKSEHVVDLETDLMLSATVYHADHGDTLTLEDSVVDAQTNLRQSGSAAEIENIVADKGYHGAETLAEIQQHTPYRTYIPEPQLPRNRRWTDKPPEQQQAVYNNRRRVRRERSKRFQKLRSQLLERSFAHICETGGARRTWLRGLEKVQKRYLLAAAARNLGLIMRKLFGFGTARALQPEGCFFSFIYLALCLVQDCLRLLSARLITFTYLLMQSWRWSRFLVAALSKSQFCRVGGAEAPPLIKPDERVSRIRLSREYSAQGMRG